MLKQPQDVVNLIHLALLELILNSELVSVCLTDSSILPGPLIPDVTSEVRNSVRLLLPNPQQLVKRELDSRRSYGKSRKLLL